MDPWSSSEPWVLEQADAFKRHLTKEKLTGKLLMHDRDTKFTKLFDEAFTSGQRNVKVSTFRSPNTNAYVARFIQSLQQECLDHLVVFGKAHFDPPRAQPSS
jgi:putative transposase